MKVIIAGSRTIKDYRTVADAILESKFTITEVFCGCAEGVDELGRKWANIHRVPVRDFPAKWDDIERPGAVVKTRADGLLYDAAAGSIRNGQMVEQAEALVLIFDGHSKGSKDILGKAQKKGLKIYQKVVKAYPLIPFGKFKGQTIDQVDPSYLDWTIGQDWFEEKFPVLYKQICAYLNEPDVARQLEEELERRS